MWSNCDIFVNHHQNDWEKYAQCLYEESDNKTAKVLKELCKHLFFKIQLCFLVLHLLINSSNHFQYSAKRLNIGVL